jgi:hypothetical protein
LSTKFILWHYILDVQVIKSLITATKHRFGPIQREPTVEDGLDIVAIPKGNDGKIKIEDYFAVYPHLPDGSFGAMSGFQVVMQLPEACKGGNMTLSIQSLPAFEPSEDKGRFAMDWHVCSSQGTYDMDSAVKWLGGAHNGVSTAFERAFTQKGLYLFEPEGR